MNLEGLKKLADAAIIAKESAAKKEAQKQINNVLTQAEVAARAGSRHLEYKGPLNKLAVDQLRSEGFCIQDVAEEGYCYMISGW